MAKDSTKKASGVVGVTVVAAAVGAIAAMLVTKKTGPEVRNDIREQLTKTKHDITAKAKELRAQAEVKAEQAKTRIKETSDTVAEEAKQRSEELKDALDEAERKRKSS